jgi:hypothetical protein
MRLSVRARPLLTLVYVTGLLALPAAASAAGSSPVHVDPKSPVAKEYALPLASARGAAPESGNSGKLFGSGIRHNTSSTTTHSSAPTAVATSPVTKSEAPVVASPQSVAEPAPVTTVAPAPAPTTPTHTTVTQPLTTQTAASQTTRPRTTSPAVTHVTTVTLPDLTETGGPRPVSAAPAAYTVLRPGSGPGVLWMVLAGVLVVALGSAGGVILSRRR